MSMAGGLKKLSAQFIEPLPAMHPTDLHHYIIRGGGGIKEFRVYRVGMARSSRASLQQAGAKVDLLRQESCEGDIWRPSSIRNCVVVGALVEFPTSNGTFSQAGAAANCLISKSCLRLGLGGGHYKKGIMNYEGFTERVIFSERVIFLEHLYRRKTKLPVR